MKILDKLWRYRERSREEYFADRIVEDANTAKEFLEKETVEDDWELPCN